MAGRTVQVVKAGDGTGQQGHTHPRHVWVCLTGNWSTASPGVLLDWRQSKGRWQAQVMWAEGGGNIAVHSHLAWVAAEHVRLRE